MLVAKIAIARTHARRCWLSGKVRRAALEFDVDLTAEDDVECREDTFLSNAATLSTGDRVVVWRALPDIGQWATATLLWTGSGLVTLSAVASRHREGRRP